MTVHAISNASIGPGSERPPADNPTGGVSTIPFGLYIDSDTGTVYETTGEQWVPIGQLPAGTSLPGVMTDGMNGVKAQNFTAYPVIPDPTEGPIVTAIPAADTGYAPLPAGTYEYAVAYQDVSGNSTLYFAGSSVSLDGTQLAQLEPPLSKPANVLYAAYARLRSDDNFYDLAGGQDATIPFVDFLQDDAVLFRDQLIGPGWFNQTYPTAVLGGTTINGPAQVMGGIGTHGVAPQTAPRTLAQTVIDAMTDANAKTAVQAVADALADIGALTLT